MEPYKEAFKHDALICRLAKEEPPTADNARQWLTFTRTVMSSLRILELKARDLLGLKEGGD